jgi:hypothetical protein
VDARGNTQRIEIKVRIGMHSGEVRSVVHPNGQRDTTSAPPIHKRPASPRARMVGKSWSRKRHASWGRTSCHLRSPSWIWVRTRLKGVGEEPSVR